MLIDLLINSFHHIQYSPRTTSQSVPTGTPVFINFSLAYTGISALNWHSLYMSPFLALSDHKNLFTNQCSYLLYRIDVLAMLVVIMLSLLKK